MAVQAGHQQSKKPSQTKRSITTGSPISRQAILRVMTTPYMGDKVRRTCLDERIRRCAGQGWNSIGASEDVTGRVDGHAERRSGSDLEQSGKGRYSAPCVWDMLNLPGCDSIY